MEMHFATIWESIADAVPGHDAVVQGDRRVSWREYDDRSARLAQVLLDAGLGFDSKVAMFMYSTPEYAETQYAALKIRASPVNVNYRYLDDELHYLLDNADAEAVVFHSSLGDRIGRVKDRLPFVKTWIQVVDDDPIDGYPEYETLIAAAEPAARIERSGTDTYMFYTGGTTGMPKGVMYEIGNFIPLFLQTTPPLIGLEPFDEPSTIAETIKPLVDAGNGLVSMSGPPLMHGTGAWLGLMSPHLFGATAVLPEGRSFDPDAIWDAVERNGVNILVIVGDAFARPLLRRLEERAETGTVPDLGSLSLMVSSGAMFSTEVKSGLLEFLETTMIVDTLGSTEGGMAMSITAKNMEVETASFTANATTKVFDENDNEIVPGSGEVGIVATSGVVPLGYYKDEEKSARTFREIDGVRYSFPGDMATIEADGTIQLLGRGNHCINTGGEKVFPEEVEEALKAHDAVFDCLVFGVDDERFGQRVVAVASLEEGHAASVDEILIDARDRLASYKLPKQLVLTGTVPRTSTGKADYPSAKEIFAAV